MSASEPSRKATATAGSMARLLRHTGIYAIGTVVAKLSGLLLAPLYLDPGLLPMEAYGQLQVLDAMAQVAIPLFGLGLGSGLLKFTADSCMKDDHEALPLTTLIAAGGMAVLAFLCFWFSAPLIGRFVFGSSDGGPVSRMLAAYVGLKVVAIVPYMLLRTRERVGIYVTVVMLEIVLLVVGVYYYLVIDPMGLEGVIRAYLWSSGACTTLLTAGMLARIPFRVHWRLLRPLVCFGAPIALSGLSYLFLNKGDILILNWLSDAKSVGEYGWASRLGGTINMFFVQSLQLAFHVIGIKQISAAGGDVSLHRRAFRHCVIWMGWGVLGVSLFSYDLTACLTSSPDYPAATRMVLPIALGFMAYGLNTIVITVLYAKGKTREIATVVIGCALLNIVLNIVLIPHFGAAAAAVTTCFSYLALLAVMACLAQRLVRIDYAWRLLGSVILLIVVLYLIAEPSLAWMTGQRLGLRFGLIAAYPVLVLALGLYRRAELERARQWTLQRLRTFNSVNVRSE